VPFAEGRLIAAGIAGAQFVPIDSRNHLLLEQESGWARWLDAVQEFLSQRTNPALSASLANLSVRQREMVELLAQGRDNAQIAATLGLSDKTVRNQISVIFNKLQVENRGQAIVRAREAGLGQEH
jgi:DNA-binding NarL/FixJ family response regulator